MTNEHMKALHDYGESMLIRQIGNPTLAGVCLRPADDNDDCADNTFWVFEVTGICDESLLGAIIVLKTYFTWGDITFTEALNRMTQ